MEVNDVIAQEVLYKVTVAQEVLYMNYLSVRPLVLSNTLSHIWDNNIGKFNLSHIWDRVLLNTKGLTLK